ncbi:hypothetical protein TRFO_36814 [Tritrichomonas foetus]|uniref:Uncharacterized protein n=1 Tax=Tritrichomonas foetus TaxID=1144522 RepID=A0A1J4JFG5_9EUKA|nr:hypothetical protein TRFO_36814 [Tritrichomonas foetus]|eukprot:OHS97031.1 hypothetical protein TRFO_36814 [Tritrichomonas foetus]
MNGNERYSSLETIFDDHKESLLEMFKAIYEKIISNVAKYNSPESIQRFIEKSVKDISISEREQFIFYLITIIEELSKLTHSKDPNFIARIKEDVKHFNDQYDSEGQLSLILTKYFSQPGVPLQTPKIKAFFPYLLGFSYESTMMRSMLFDLRKVIIDTLKEFSSYVENIKKETTKSFHHLIKTTIRDNTKKIEEVYRQKLNKVNIENENLKLKIEGELIQIINSINSINNVNSFNSQGDLQTCFISLSEIRKQAKNVMNSIRQTNIPELSINGKEQSDLYRSLHDKISSEYSDKVQLTSELKEKNSLILNLRSQISDLKSELLRTTLEHSNSALLGSPNQFIDERISDSHSASSIHSKQSSSSVLITKEMQTEPVNDQSNNFLLQMIEVLKQKNTKKKNTINLLKEQLQSLTAKLEVLTKRTKKLQEKVSTVNKTPELFDTVLYAKGSLLLEEITDRTNSLIESENKIKELEKENRQLVNQMEILQESNSITSKQVARLKEDISNIQNSSINDLNELSQELEEKQQIIREQADKLVQFDKYSQKIEKYKQYKAQYNLIYARHQNLKAAVKQNQIEIQQMWEKNNRINKKLKIRLIDLKQKVDQNQDIIQQLTHENQSLTNKIENSRTSITSCDTQTENDSYKSLIFDLFIVLFNEELDENRDINELILTKKFDENYERIQQRIFNKIEDLKENNIEAIKQKLVDRFPKLFSHESSIEQSLQTIIFNSKYQVKQLKQDSKMYEEQYFNIQDDLIRTSEHYMELISRIGEFLSFRDENQIPLQIEKLLDEMNNVTTAQENINDQKKVVNINDTLSDFADDEFIRESGVDHAIDQEKKVIQDDSNCDKKVGTRVTEHEPSNRWEEEDKSEEKDIQLEVVDEYRSEGEMNQSGVDDKLRDESEELKEEESNWEEEETNKEFSFAKNKIILDMLREIEEEDEEDENSISIKSYDKKSHSSTIQSFLDENNKSDNRKEEEESTNIDEENINSIKSCGEKSYSSSISFLDQIRKPMVEEEEEELDFEE